MNQQDSKAIVVSKYSEGVYSLYDVFKLVSIKYLTKEEFHQITSFNYDGVTKAQVGLGSVANLDQSKAIKSITRSGTTFTQQDTNTTYPVFAGATASENGTTGLVPEPTIEDAGKYLCGDGTWKTVSGGTGASDSPVEIPIEKLGSITGGKLVVYKIGHLLQIYGSNLSVKRNGSSPDAGVCTIHNFDGLKLGFSISTWTAFELQSYTFKVSASGFVVAEPDGPDIFNVLLMGEPGSSQTGVYFSLTVPLLDKKEE